MSMRAVRIMTAGQAGLRSLPHFMQEFIDAGIPMLEPFALDHSSDQIRLLEEETEQYVNDHWSKHVYNMGTKIGTPLESATTEITDAVANVNPEAAKTNRTQIADSPAHIAAATRRRLRGICEETMNKWDDFRAHHGLDRSGHLAVIIPYCPEGPTSGTVSAIIGAGLRQHFRDLGRPAEVIVWGIELCPPHPGEHDTNAINAGNLFRGFIARQEIHDGVAIDHDPNLVDRLHKPFDINLVIDAGRIKENVGEREEHDIHQALDRAAAQTTRVMLQGPAGDAEETRALLQQDDGRWNGLPIHVISSRSWDLTAQYWRYRSQLPWINDDADWERTSLEVKRELIDHAVRNIAPALDRDNRRAEAKNDPEDHEKHVRDAFNSLTARARDIPKGRLNLDFWHLIKVSPLIACTLGLYYLMERNNAQRNAQRADERIRTMIRREEEDYQAMIRLNSHSVSALTPRSDLFCVNTVLTPAMYERAARSEQKRNARESLATTIGSAGVNTVQSAILQHVNVALERGQDRQEEAGERRSSAYFNKIIVVRVVPRSMNNNAQMSPPENQVKYLLDADRRNGASAYTANTIILDRNLCWTTRENPHQDMESQMLYIILAKPRKGEGFRDVSTFRILEEKYRAVIEGEDPREWARYYSGRPPQFAGGDLPRDLPEPVSVQSF